MTRTGARRQGPPAPPRTSAVPASGSAPRRALALIGVVDPVGYLVLVTVLGMLWDGYDPIRDTQSELGAVDSPYRLVMNLAGFMGLGVSILAFAAELVRGATGWCSGPPCGCPCLDNGRVHHPGERVGEVGSRPWPSSASTSRSGAHRRHGPTGSRA
jgi:hypothetical protein